MVNFNHLQNEPEGTPETLFKVGALLIKRGLIDLHVLYSHLGPSYEVMKTEYNKLLSDAREKVEIKLYLKLICSYFVV